MASSSSNGSQRIQHELLHDYQLRVSHVQASSIKKGDVILLRGPHPCKIVQLSRSKPGLHSVVTKVYLVGLDLFTGKKYEDIVGANRDVLKPDITKEEFLLTGVKDETVILVDANGNTLQDIKVPSGQLGERLTDAFRSGKKLSVTVISCMGKRRLLTYQEKRE